MEGQILWILICEMRAHILFASLTALYSGARFRDAVENVRLECCKMCMKLLLELIVSCIAYFGVIEG
jgi:hypothetical protein